MIATIETNMKHHCFLLLISYWLGIHPKKKKKKIPIFISRFFVLLWKFVTAFFLSPLHISLHFNFLLSLNDSPSLLHFYFVSYILFQNICPISFWNSKSTHHFHFSCLVGHHGCLRTLLVDDKDIFGIGKESLTLEPIKRMYENYELTTPVVVGL